MILRAWIFLWIFVISGCSLKDDFPYASHKDLVVVNGLLHPDSIIKVSITKSGKYPGSSEFEVVEDAILDLYGDDEHLGRLQYKEDKNYHLNHYPKENKTYKLAVTVQGFPLIRAATRIPSTPGVYACFAPFDRPGISFNNQINVIINIDNKKIDGHYWCNFVSRVFKRERLDPDNYYSWYTDSSQLVDKLVYSVFSTSPLIDKFNGMNDRGLNSYDSYLKIINPGIHVDPITIDAFSFESDYFFTYSKIRDLAEGLGLFLNVYKASEEFDRYMKSSLLIYLNNNQLEWAFNPFVEIITSYSNIENGHGIFAGYNSVKIPIHLNPCK